jgi:hypothetical protein
MKPQKLRLCSINVALHQARQVYIKQGKFTSSKASLHQARQVYIKQCGFTSSNAALHQAMRLYISQATKQLIDMDALFNIKD